MNAVASRRSILGPTFIVGWICFAAGYIGPLILSDSNLGPLLGIFITGPVGTVAGMLIGIVRSAVHNPGPLRRELWWLAGAWALSLFLLLAFSTAGFGWVALPLPLAVLGTGAFLLARKSNQLPEWARRGGGLVLAAGLLTVVTSIFPPLASSRASGAKFAFFLDERFDASRRVPEFRVDRAMLLHEWLVIAALAVAAVLLIRARSKTPSR